MRLKSDFYDLNSTEFLSDRVTSATDTFTRVNTKDAKDVAFSCSAFEQLKLDRPPLKSGSSFQVNQVSDRNGGHERGFKSLVVSPRARRMYASSFKNEPV